MVNGVALGTTDTHHICESQGLGTGVLNTTVGFRDYGVRLRFSRVRR